MKFEYLFVTYTQTKGGYRFYADRNEEGIMVKDVSDILPILNHYGSEGWEFICWDSGRMLFKREIKTIS